MDSGPRIFLTTDQKTIEQCALMMSGTDPWLKLGIGYEQCLLAFEGPCREIYKVELEYELAGFVILQICGSFKGYIQTICINQFYRGRGLGTRILQFCEERILKISPNIFICVSSFNTGALRLYQSFGFKLVGELENFVKEGYSELLLRKTFGPTSGYKSS
jgi:[ribosomal protein S18]-alanine N-acetyltransferase